MKIYNYIRSLLLLVLGLVIILTKDYLMAKEGQYLPFIVSFNMLLLGGEAFVIALVKKNHKDNLFKFVVDSISLLAGLVVLLMPVAIKEKEQLIIVTCYIWGIWAILREVMEVVHLFKHAKHLPITSVLNLLESVVIIIFSVMLLIEPGEHHAATHVIILGIELLLEVLWPFLYREEKELRHKEG